MSLLVRPASVSFTLPDLARPLDTAAAAAAAKSTMSSSGKVDDNDGEKEIDEDDDDDDGFEVMDNGGDDDYFDGGSINNITPLFKDIAVTINMSVKQSVGPVIFLSPNSLSFFLTLDNLIFIIFVSLASSASQSPCNTRDTLDRFSRVLSDSNTVSFSSPLVYWYPFHTLSFLSHRFSSHLSDDCYV